MHGYIAILLHSPMLPWKELYSYIPMEVVPQGGWRVLYSDSLNTECKSLHIIIIACGRALTEDMWLIVIVAVACGLLEYLVSGI